MISFRRPQAAVRRPKQPVVVGALSSVTDGGGGIESEAMKLSAVYACATIRAESMGKLPVYIMRSDTREHATVKTFPLLEVLQVRPNEAMTPSIRMQVLENSRLLRGNSYDWIIRDPISEDIKELIPLPDDYVEPYIDDSGAMWYVVTNPVSGQMFKLPAYSMDHFKCYSRRGLKGSGILRYAADIVSAGLYGQQYEKAFYANGGSVSGILTTEQDLGGDVELENPDGTTETLSVQEKIRRDWEKIHSGPDKAYRIAVLDHDLKYQPLAISNRDAQFVESKDLSVQDIARFFKVPLYKLQSGKQAYSSNEQNSIEYVVGTLHPGVVQYEQEMTYKQLFASQVGQNWKVRMNMMAELRGDNASRSAWYKAMRECGYFSVNDIAALEDTPDVPGGDIRLASRNFYPLDGFDEYCSSNKGGNA